MRARLVAAMYVVWMIAGLTARLIVRRHLALM